MAEETDLNFGKLAVEKGFCTQAQVNEGVQLLEAVRKLGMKDDLGAILLKRKYLTEQQAEEVRRVEGQRAGVTIAGYHILEKIAHGGMGVVFKARQVSLDRVVALKILSPRLAADGEFCERFLREARAVAKLSHPNIIVGIDVGQEGKYYYFAMEYVDGRTALQILSEEGPFGEQRALRIAQQMARALDHAHKHGLVHRDVKPDNIMVGANDEAKLCDLGLAKRAELEAEAAEPGTAVGTPHYISPEQARGEDDVDIRSDIYSLGAALYHMATGQTLFQGDSNSEIMTQHLSAEAPNARRLRPELSENFCRLLETMLAKDRADRQQTPGELLGDVERALDGKAVRHTLRAGAACSMARPPRTFWRLTGRPTAEPATGPRAPLGFPHGSSGPRRPVDRSATLRLAGVAAVLALMAGAGFYLTRKPEQIVTASGGKKEGPSKTPPDDAGKKATAPPAKPGGEPDNKVEAPAKQPTAKPSWEPLDKARAARREKPGDYVALLALYAGAEQDAPAELLDEIRQERSAIEKALDEAFRGALEEQRRAAQAHFDAQEYVASLACLQDEKFAPELLSEGCRQQLARAREDWAEAIWREYRRGVEPSLKEELDKAGLNAPRLAPLRDKVAALMQRYPVPSVKGSLETMRLKIEQRLAKIEATQKQAQEGGYRMVLEEIQRTAAAPALRSFAKAAEACGEQKRFLAQRFQAWFDTFQEDLQAGQSFFDKAHAALNASADAQQTVSLHHPPGSPQASAVKLLARFSGGDGLGAWMRGPQGAQEALLYAKLDERDVLALAGAKEDTPAARRLAGSFWFWRGRYDQAGRLLGPLASDADLGARAAPYVQWMETTAAELIGQLEKLYQEGHDSRLAPDEREKRRQQAGEIRERLRRDFGATEVYRARTEEAP